MRKKNMRKWSKKRKLVPVLSFSCLLGVLFSASISAASYDGSKPLFQSRKTNETKRAVTGSHSAKAYTGTKSVAERAKIEALLKSSTLADQAFSKVTKDLMPMTPSQIKTLHYLFDKTQQAASAAADTPPRPETTALSVNLSPGATPPVIRLSSGLVTSLVFMDATSAPWPIEWYDVGDPKRFNVKTDSKGGSNTMMIQALTTYKSANMAIKLKGLSTPVMLTLLPGQETVDYRVDLRVPGVGPHAISAGSSLPISSNPQLLNALNGVSPVNSKALIVLGGNAEAWRVDDKLYMRTRLTVLSPGWIARMSSGDGTNAYELPVTPVVLALDNGATVSLSIKEQ